MKKKVLFVTYYWPPAGGAAVNRTLKFQKYLGEFGWKPIILTVQDGDYPSEDPSLGAEVSEGTEVVTSKNVSLFAPLRPFLKKGGYLKPRAFTDGTDQRLKTRLLRFFKFNIIPDTRIGWRITAVKKGMELLKDHKIDLIYSTSPPQTNHIIASILSERAGTPWVGDFRDPWSDQFWLKDSKIRLALTDSLDRSLEKRTLQKMTHIVSNSPGLKDILQKKTDRPISVIFNGFDAEQVEADGKSDQTAQTRHHAHAHDTTEIRNNAHTHDSTETRQILEPSAFTLLFAGSVSFQHRPVGLINALKQLQKEQHPILQPLKVQFMGSLPSFVEEMFQEAGLHKNLVFLPFRPMNEAIRQMQKSDILLLLGVENSTMGVIPSKLFEYLSCRRPVLAYGLENDAATILQRSGAGYHEAFDDPNGRSAEFIKKVYEGRFQMPENQDYVRQFHRRELTRQLASLFDDVLKNHQTAP